MEKQPKEVVDSITRDLDSITRDLDSPEEVQVCTTTHTPQESGKAHVSQEINGEARLSTEIFPCCNTISEKEISLKNQETPNRLEPE